jgi:putative MFS transporter
MAATDQSVATLRSPTTTELNIVRRLERLPMTRAQLKLLFMAGLGLTFEAEDLAIIAFIMPQVAKQFHMTSAQTGLLGSAAFIGYLVGAFLAGTMGDLIGRKKVMLYALGIFCVFTLFAAGSNSWQFLFWCRLIAGLGFGAEAAIVCPFFSEFVPGKSRGKYIGSLAGFFSFGFVIAALLGYNIVPASPQGWRTVLVLSALPVVLLLWWRRGILESPRWLIQQGRVKEAEEIVSTLETRVARWVPELPSPESVPMPVLSIHKPKFFQNLGDLFARENSRTTTMLWILFFAISFSYYGLTTWIPAMLVREGMTVTKSFGYSLVIYSAIPVGYYGGALVCDWLDRKWTIALCMLGGGLAGMPMIFVRKEGLILFFAFLMYVFMSGVYPAMYAYSSEVYPTNIRATGLGVASAFGRIGAIGAPILIGFTYAKIGFGGVFAVAMAVLLVGAAGTAILGISTTGKTLEQITADQISRVRRTKPAQ